MMGYAYYGEMMGGFGWVWILLVLAVVIAVVVWGTRTTLRALHQARLDGTGYHRGLGSTALSMSARVLAVADVYQALTEPRPHRPAARPTRPSTSCARRCGQGALTARRQTLCLPRPGTGCEVPAMFGRPG
jgi:hypothetical protein